MVVWCGYVAFTLTQATWVSPVQWADSTAYAQVSSAPLLSRSFWTGARPPVVPLVMRLVGTSTGFAVLQTVVAVLSWGLLCFALARVLRPGVARVIGVLAVVLFASADPIALWNNSILSESLALSTLVVIVSAALLLVERPTWPRVALLVAASLLFAATRDTGIATVAMFAVVAFIAHAISRRSPSPSRHWLAAGLALTCVVVVTGSGLVVSDRSSATIGDVYYVRVFAYPDRVAWFAAHGMPERAAIDRFAKDAPRTVGAAPTAFITPSTPGFGPLWRWMDQHASTTYYEYLATHPLYVLTAPLVRPEMAYNFAQGDLNFYAAAGRLSSPATPLVWPDVVGFGLIVLLAFIASVWYAAWRQRAWRVAIVVAGIGVLAMLVVWHGDGQETTRHTIEGLVELRLGVWLALVVAALGPHDAPALAWRTSRI